MGHYAKVENGVVVNVIVAEYEYISTLPDADSYVKTSYNTRGGVHYVTDTNTPSEDQTKALRKNFACIGGTYDAGRDAFIPIQDAPSWTLNEDTCLWEAPEAMPDTEGDYDWNEESYQNGTGGWLSVS